MKRQANRRRIWLAVLAVLAAAILFLYADCSRAAAHWTARMVVPASQGYHFVHGKWPESIDELLRELRPGQREFVAMFLDDKRYELRLEANPALDEAVLTVRTKFWPREWVYRIRCTDHEKCRHYAVTYLGIEDNDQADGEMRSPADDLVANPKTRKDGE